MPFEIEGIVLGNRYAGNNTAWISIYAPQIARTALPGQFVMVEAVGKFLRRPISIASVSGGRIFLLIRIVGDGTRIIASVRRNEKLKILGPLGNGFPENVQNPILVGGGIGIAPLIFASQKMKENGKSFVAIYGERTADDIIWGDFLPENVQICTDDGSAGFRGTTVDLLKKQNPAPIFACGPQPMLKAISEIAYKWNVPAYISLEERMACGFGVCQGCVVKTKNGYRRVCTDGPVFAATEIYENTR